MAFLDNSGDIILDAVLTDVGRKRMAQGNFRITKFALGDDEVNYGLYNKASASGSAYYDLEILQTPVLEAFSQTNAGINYGLLSLTAPDLLYMPVFEINTKLMVTNAIAPKSTFPNIFFVASTAANTVTKLLATGSLASTKYFTVSNQYDGSAILIEGGLNTAAVTGGPSERTSYLVSNNLIDNTAYVYYDNRFFNGIIAADSTSTYNNDNNGIPNLQLHMKRAAPISTDLQIDNYSAVRISCPNNGIVYNQDYSTPDTTVSAIAGPRSVFAALNFDVKTSLTVEFSRYGTVSNDLFGDGNSYSFIDTMIYLQGATTGMQIQIPVRIIKYVGT
jgi:hypothetical protein